MNLELPSAARAFADSVDRAVTGAGGTALARACEQDPGRRVEVEALLEELGALDLDPCGELDEVMAAVELCRLAGQHVLPWPVAGTLAAEAGAVALIDPSAARIAHGDLGPWTGWSLDRRAHRCVPSGRPLSGVLMPHVVEMEVAPLADPVSEQRLAALVWLQAATAVGALQSALRLTIEHVSAREQFGRRLADFQAVRFRLADMAVAERGLAELLYFTAWSTTAGGSSVPLADALVLQVSILEQGKSLVRSAHQLLGALGFCDEHDLSLVSRHLQPLLRLPHDLEAATEALDAEIAPVGMSVLAHDR